MCKQYIVASIIGLLVAIIAVPVYAQDGDLPDPDTITDDEVNAIADDLYCPVCENIPLDVCGTQACADWRAEIRNMLAQGMTEDEIRAEFAANYGQRVLDVPERTGLNTFFWLLPIIGVGVGVVVLGIVLARMAPGALAATREDVQVRYDDLDADYVARLERELKEYAS